MIFSGFSVVNTIKELLAEHDENKRAESEYKRQCRQEIAELDDEIERLQRLKESDGAVRLQTTLFFANL